MRIIIDQDSVLYDLHDPWVKLHNKDHPKHRLDIAHRTGWDANAACKAAGCNCNNYAYFDDPWLWRAGKPLLGSVEVTSAWAGMNDVELGILTTAANALCLPHKVEWLQRYFPHIPNVMLVHKAHIKHWVSGDIIIDDGIHNLEKWPGVRICFAQPWNAEYKGIRVRDWAHTGDVVNKSLALLRDGLARDQVEEIIRQEMV